MMLQQFSFVLIDFSSPVQETSKGIASIIFEKFDNQTRLVNELHFRELYMIHSWSQSGWFC